MSINTQIRTQKAVEAVWIIFDPLDRSHVFGSETKARNTLKRWEEEADGDPFDPVWDMTGPLKYSLANANCDAAPQGSVIHELLEIFESWKQNLTSLTTKKN